VRCGAVRSEAVERHGDSHAGGMEDGFASCPSEGCAQDSCLDFLLRQETRHLNHAHVANFSFVPQSLFLHAAGDDIYVSKFEMRADATPNCQTARACVLSSTSRGVRDARAVAIVRPARRLNVSADRAPPGRIVLGETGNGGEGGGMPGDCTGGMEGGSNGEGGGLGGDGGGCGATIWL
jgi:hypothetical protein